MLSGVGDKKFVHEYGKYHLTLALHDGKYINLSGICLDKITPTFPTYPLNEVEKDKVTPTFPTYPLNEVEKDKITPTFPTYPLTEVEKDKITPTFPTHPLNEVEKDKITHTFPTYPLNEVEKDKVTPTFPTHPLNEVEKGNLVVVLVIYRNCLHTDLMIGIQYLEYYPGKMFELSNVLSIYKSPFVGCDGSRLIVAGPHRILSEIHKSLGNNYVSISAYVRGNSDLQIWLPGKS